jgi:hypothetical protein
MRITNNSKIALRLHMFNAGDLAKVLALENWVLQKGESRTYRRGSYVFHVWKSQFPFDAGIKWTDELWTDVVFTGDAKNLSVQGGPKPPVTIANNAGEQLKVCVYKADDSVYAFALQCWTFGAERTIEWKTAPTRFSLRVYKPALLDDPLMAESDLQDMSALTISRKKPWWKFWSK